MSGPFDLAGPSLAPRAGAQPDSAVVLLHGYGADGNDLIALAPEWSSVLPRTLFVAPHAPFPCELGGFGRQWYGFERRPPEMVAAGQRAAAAIVDSFLDALVTRLGLAHERVALVGFSQGTMLSLHVAPRRERPLAGVLGYSGKLIDGAALAAETRARPPVLLIHGAADELVPAAELAAAEAALAAAGFAIETHLRPGLGHAIDRHGILLGAQFLKERLTA